MHHISLRLSLSEVKMAIKNGAVHPQHVLVPTESVFASNATQPRSSTSGEVCRHRLGDSFKYVILSAHFCGMSILGRVPCRAPRWQWPAHRALFIELRPATLSWRQRALQRCSIHTNQLSYIAYTNVMQAGILEVDSIVVLAGGQVR